MAMPSGRRSSAPSPKPIASGTAGARNAYGGAHRLSVPNALQDGMGTKPAGQLAYSLDCGVPPLADDISRPEPASQGNAVGVTAEHDDLLRTETTGGNDAAETHRAVANDLDARADQRRGHIQHDVHWRIIPDMFDVRVVSQRAEPTRPEHGDRHRDELIGARHGHDSGQRPLIVAPVRCFLTVYEHVVGSYSTREAHLIAARRLLRQ